MTTDIAKTQEASVPSLNVEEETGLHGDFDQGDVALPMCAITQPTSAEERGDPGKFWFNDGHSVDAMETVVLDIIGTRTLWAPKGKSSIDGVVCRSSDRRDGIARYPSVVLSKEPAKEKVGELDTKFIACNLCPHFNDDQYGSDDYLCKKGYTLLMADSTTNEVFLYYVKGAAMKPVTTRVVSPAIARVKRGEPAAPWLTPFRWTIRSVQNKKGKFYVPDVVPATPLGEEDAAFYASLSASMSSRVADQMESEDLEEPEQAPLTEA